MLPDEPAHAPAPALSPADAVRAYHRRTKHRFERYADGPQALDWEAQPAPFRHYTGAPRTALPLLNEVAPSHPVALALSRPFAELAAPTPPVPPSLAALGAFLHVALGLTAWKSYGPDRWSVRANPSSGNLHPTEAYVLAFGVAGLPDGLYHYDPLDHVLECRARYLQLPEGCATGLHVALSSVMWREAWKYGERAFRYCQLDTGHAVASLRYAAAALGWTLAAQRHVGSDLLGSLLGLDRPQDFPPTRSGETEQEEAEILLSLGFNGLPPPWIMPRVLREAAATPVWLGVATAIDTHPMYRWPVIGEIAQLTRAVGDAPPAPPAAARAAPVTPWPETICRSISEVLLGRRSAQRFDPQYRMPRGHFLTFLQHLLPHTGAPWDAMPCPWRIDLVLFVHRVEGFVPGVYVLSRGSVEEGVAPILEAHAHLHPVEAIPVGLGLQCVSALDPGALQRLARSLHCHQDIAAHSSFALGMLCEFDAALETTPAAYRELHRQVGVIGQVLYLEAEACGLRGTGIGCYFDDGVHEMLGLEDSRYQALYHFTVGKPVHDPRIETMAAYADHIYVPSPEESR